jgi:hypothetical protein
MYRPKPITRSPWELRAESRRKRLDIDAREQERDPRHAQGHDPDVDREERPIGEGHRVLGVLVQEIDEESRGEKHPAEGAAKEGRQRNGQGGHDDEQRHQIPADALRCDVDPR